MIFLLMLLTALASSGYFNFDTDVTTTTPSPKLSFLKRAKVKNIPKQRNYITKHIVSCPDVGYFFKREAVPLNSQAVGTCLLCFCKENATAVCWPRANRKCDKEHYYHVGVGKRESRPRSRRSPGLSLSNLFMRDATRDVLNAQSPEQCKPHEASYSEGCPPADWCVGCTVCDCDANGRWDCHLLSFCSEEDKKKRKQAKGKTYVQKSVDGNGHHHRRSHTPHVSGDKAQAEVQRLAKLISDIGDKQARKYKGMLPHRRHLKSRRQGSGNIETPIKRRRAHTRKNISSINAIRNPNWIHKESVNGSKPRIELVNRHNQVKKEKVNSDNVKKLADLHKRKKKNVVQPTTTTTKRPKKKYERKNLRTPKPTKKPVRRQSYDKRVLAMKQKKERETATKKTFAKKPAAQKGLGKKKELKKKVIRKPIKPTTKTTSSMTRTPTTEAAMIAEPTTTTKRTTITEATKTIETTKAIEVTKSTSKPQNKHHRRKAVSRKPQLDHTKIIEHIQQKHKDQFLKGMQQLVLSAASSQADSSSRDKRSAPLVKALSIKKSIGTVTNHTRSKAVPISLKRSSKINVDKSSKVKLHRNKRSLIEDPFVTVDPELFRNDIPARLLEVLPKTTTGNISDMYYKYHVDNHMTVLSEDDFGVIPYKKGANSKRSVDNLMENISDVSVIKLTRQISNKTDADNKTVSEVTEGTILNFTDDGNMIILTLATPMNQSDSDDQNNKIIPIGQNLTDVTEKFIINITETTNETLIDTDVLPIKLPNKDPAKVYIVNITDITVGSQTEGKTLSLHTLPSEWVEDKIVLNVSDYKDSKDDGPILPINTNVDLTGSYPESLAGGLAVLGKQKDVNEHFVINVTDVISESKPNKFDHTQTSNEQIVQNIGNVNNSSLLVQEFSVTNTPTLEIFNETFVINITDFNHKDIDAMNEIKNEKVTEKATDVISKGEDDISEINLTTSYEVKDRVSTKSVLHDSTLKHVVATDKPDLNLLNTEIMSETTTEAINRPIMVTVDDKMLTTLETENNLYIIKINNTSNISTTTSTTTTIVNVTSDNDIEVLGVTASDWLENVENTTPAKLKSESTTGSTTTMTEYENIMKINETDLHKNLTEQIIKQPLIIVTNQYVNTTPIVVDGEAKDNIVKQEDAEQTKQNLSSQTSTEKNLESIVIVREDTLKSNPKTHDSNDTWLVLTTENIVKSKYKTEDNLDIKSEDHELKPKTKKIVLNSTVVREEIMPLPKVENYLKYKIDKSMNAAKQMKQKSKRRKKGKKYNKKLHHNGTESKKDQHPKLERTTQKNNTVPSVLPKSQEITTVPNKVALNTIDTNDYKSNWVTEKIDTNNTMTTESYSSKTNVYTAEIKPTVETHSSPPPQPKNKVNTYDIKKINVAPKKHRLKKIVNTLCSKGGKDGRIYYNSENDPSKGVNDAKRNKNSTRSNDLKNFFKKLLSGLGPRKGSKKDNKPNKFKMIKYLQKFFKKIFAPGKHNHSQNSTDIPQLNKRTIMETLCITFGPCNINIKNKAKLQSQLDHLNMETYQMLRSIKIIKGLLKLLDIPNKNQKINGTTNKNTTFKSDIQKLHAILRNSYEVDHDLTETQKMQIQHIKNTTQIFIQAAAKFTITLNEIINIITDYDHANKTMDDKVHKRNIKDGNAGQNNTEKHEPITKLRDLISRYSIIQNSFMNRIYKVLYNLDQNGQSKMERNVDTNKSVVQNKTEAIQVYTRNIIQNLRKLKALAQNLNGSVRRKRDLRDDDSIEYLLMLMEYLLKQNHPLDAAPVNDGIDLLIEAIKNAPDIKPIKKKVLHHMDTFKNISKPLMKLSSETNASREDSLSEDNKIFAEHNRTFNLQEFKYNVIDHSSENEDEDDKLIFKKEDVTTKSTTAEDLDHHEYHYSSPKTIEVATIPVFKGPNYKSPAAHQAYQNENIQLTENKVMNYKPYIEAAENKLNFNSNETEDPKYDFFNADLDDEVVTTTVLETEYTTSKPALSTTLVDKKFRSEKNEDVSASLSKSKLDWLDETYEEEIKAELNTSATTYKPHKSNFALTKQPRKTEDLSDFSREVSDLKKGSGEDVMYKKELELMNSLDYGSDKADGDTSDSKESVSDDKYSGDTFSSYF